MISGKRNILKENKNKFECLFFNILYSLSKLYLRKKKSDNYHIYILNMKHNFKGTFSKINTAKTAPLKINPNIIHRKIE